MTPSPEVHRVAGLAAPAEILIDTWGVPHIYAASVDDAFLVQGFNAARDRLWQIDYWRRRGLGLLAEVLGEEYIERDRAARLFLYRGDAQSDWLAHGADTEQVANAFVDGINAYVRLTRERSELLPREFQELGYLPALWDADDIRRIRSHGLFYNVREEVDRARTMRDFGTPVEDLRRRRTPPRNIEVPVSLDLADLPDDVLAAYELATGPALPEGVVSGGGTVLDGSNSWVVAGSRTASGRPLLANDPHRAVPVLPGLRYLVHLSTPQLDVIGGGEPVLPGISIGHNGRIAFGLTIFPIDQEDLYVYELNPENPRQYRYRDSWEPIRVETEPIPLQDGTTVDVELCFTRHGPVLHTDQTRLRAYALRAAWLEPGMAPYLGSVDYMRAGSWDDFLAATSRWGAPPENFVYADVDGTIGWKSAGRTPIRHGWDGLLPVPGDGRYEWAGFYGADQLPGGTNPPLGYVATANEKTLPNDFPPEHHVSYEWCAPSRKDRIDEFLAGRDALTVGDLVGLQNDYVSIPARRVLRRLGSLPLDRSLDGLDLLLSWDADLNAESAAAALYEVWFRRHFRPALLTRALTPLVGAGQAPPAAARILPREDSIAASEIELDLVEQPGRRLGPDGDATLAEIVTATLPAAVAELERLLGPERSQWQWGRLHVAWMSHPLASLLPGLPQEQLVVGPVPRGGSGDTVANTSYGPGFVQTAGATFRVVIDVGDWDESVAMNAPGQSGNLGHPHATDLFTPWANDSAFPLLYSRDRIEAATTQRLVLLPDDYPPQEADAP